MVKAKVHLFTKLTKIQIQIKCLNIRQASRYNWVTLVILYESQYNLIVTHYDLSKIITASDIYRFESKNRKNFSFLNKLIDYLKNIENFKLRNRLPFTIIVYYLQQLLSQLISSLTLKIKKSILKSLNIENESFNVDRREYWEDIVKTTNYSSSISGLIVHNENNNFQLSRCYPKLNIIKQNIKLNKKNSKYYQHYVSIT